MQRCAFLTLDDQGSYVIDDELAHQPLRELGWQVEAVGWRRPAVAWSEYAAVVIRSTWDYPQAPDAFLEVLREIERAGTRLFNPLRLVRWNLRKTYLRDLALRGIPVVPTVWRERLPTGGLPRLFDELGTAEIVVKPVVGLNADGAFRLDARTLPEQTGDVESYFRDRSVMAQAFVRSVVTEGEFSLIYFNGGHSHTILKIPRTDDFRVQEEHGASIGAVRDDEAALRAAGDAALDALDEVPLYARADFVRAPDAAGFWLMELELIEPSLYFRMDRQAPWRFARALDARMNAVAP